MKIQLRWSFLRIPEIIDNLPNPSLRAKQFRELLLLKLSRQESSFAEEHVQNLKMVDLQTRLEYTL